MNIPLIERLVERELAEQKERETSKVHMAHTLSAYLACLGCGGAEEKQDFELAEVGEYVKWLESYARRLRVAMEERRVQTKVTKRIVKGLAAEKRRLEEETKKEASEHWHGEAKKQKKGGE